MSDRHETITDIVAEKRRRADELEASSYRPHQFLRERIAELRQEADRLEAARKRDTKELRVEIERLKEERNYSGVRERERLRANGFAIVPKEQLERGDAAKLREALIKARSAICQFARHQCQSLSWENSNIQANCGDVLCSWRGLCDAKTAINAALAATEQKGESDGNE